MHEGLTLCAKKQMGRSQLGPWLHREVLKRSGCSQNSTAREVHTSSTSANHRPTPESVEDYYNRHRPYYHTAGVRTEQQAEKATDRAPAKGGCSVEASQGDQSSPVQSSPLTWVVGKCALLTPRTRRLQWQKKIEANGLLLVTHSCL